MAFTQLPNKNPGDLIKSVDWNEAIQELIDLRIEKLNHTNGTGTNLTINGPLAIGGSVSFGSQTRQMLNLWSTEYGIGVQVGTLYSRTDKDFAWHLRGVHHDGRGNPGAGGSRLMALTEAGDLILSGRTNPSAGTGSLCRAMVDGGPTMGNQLILNFANDFSGGLKVDSSLEVRNEIILSSGGGNDMRIERGVMFTGGSDTNNMLLSCARVNSGITPTYNFAVGHWRHTPKRVSPPKSASDNFVSRLFMNSDGRVGLGGVENPQAALHVTGDYLRVDGLGNEQCYIGGDGGANGTFGLDVQVGSFNPTVTSVAMYNPSNGFMDLHCKKLHESSDERLKENIQKLNGSLEKLLQLRGVSFNWKADDDKSLQMGFIAQEVEKVFPDWVSESRGTKSISTRGLLAILVEAVRELKSDLDSIKEVVGLPVSQPKTASKPASKKK